MFDEKTRKSKVILFYKMPNDHWILRQVEDETRMKRTLTIFVIDDATEFLLLETNS